MTLGKGVLVDEFEFPFEHDGVTIEPEDGGLWISTPGTPDRSFWITPAVRKALEAMHKAGGHR